ncbi:hypothetical protein GQ600_24073 [Phytophthora cactorum]|nr:hypothetical protein GQ600_24073 [Phytophthora cactorum]
MNWAQKPLYHELAASVLAEDNGHLAGLSLLARTLIGERALTETRWLAWCGGGNAHRKNGHSGSICSNEHTVQTWQHFRLYSSFPYKLLVDGEVPFCIAPRRGLQCSGQAQSTCASRCWGDPFTSTTCPIQVSPQSSDAEKRDDRNLQLALASIMSTSDETQRFVLQDTTSLQQWSSSLTSRESELAADTVFDDVRRATVVNPASLPAECCRATNRRC